MRFRASVGAMGLALSVAAPVYAQSAGTIEIGAAGRVQIHDRQYFLPESTVPPSASGLNSNPGFGFAGRLGVYFAENWSIEAGYHTVDQPSVTNTQITLRAIWNRPIGEKFSYHVGGGLGLSNLDLAPYVGRTWWSGVSGAAGNQFFGGSEGVSDVGVAGLIGTRWRFNERFAVRLDATALLVPSPSERRTQGVTSGAIQCGGAGQPSCVTVLKPESFDLPLGIELGGSLFLNAAKDTDGDGVKDKADTCPNTPKDVTVDSAGCPVDTDGDKIADYLDKCPNTPKGVAVDANGCPVDSDGDKIADYLDKCPNTPRGAAVDNNGCPLDTDRDGVADYMDKCPNTPAGVRVDANGCPIDTDADGVADYLDKCPNTAAGQKVDANGCALDNDGDGVNDTADKCPNTPAGVKVDAAGCPIDTDKDGVADYLDKCPATKAGTPIDANGCPRVFEEGKKDVVLKGVNFATGTARLTPASRPILDQVADALKGSPELRVEIDGHTDNVGNAAANMRLSQQRADAVKAYLVSKGVDASRLETKGFGSTQPIANNRTVAGRAQNRRVELKVLN